MISTNFVQLIGYIGSPLRKVGNKSPKIILNVATHHCRSRDEHNATFITTWHEVIARKKTGEFAENNFVKGSRILVQGRIVYRTYLDHAGHTRYITQIEAVSLQNLDR